MKTIKGGVRCEYWDREETFEFEMPDDATPDEIEEAGHEAALETAGFNWWLSEEPTGKEN